MGGSAREEEQRGVNKERQNNRERWRGHFFLLLSVLFVCWCCCWPLTSIHTILRCDDDCSTAYFSMRLRAISSWLSSFVIAFTLPKPPLPTT